LENENSNRRRFIRKVVGLGAVGGIAALLSTEKTRIPPVQAQPFYLQIDAVNTGAGTTELQSSGSYAAFTGWATATTGLTGGVYGQSDSNKGLGVEGYATAATGTTSGVYGTSDSTSGTGVTGYATASSGLTRGVYGQSDSTFGVGVMGKAGNPSAKPVVAQGTGGQTGNLQEWQNNLGTALSVVDKSGWLGIGTSSSARALHLQGRNACFRMDRDVDGTSFTLVRTALNNFSTIWKSFYLGVMASGVNNGSFYIGDVGTAVSGPCAYRLFIDNVGKVGIGTTTPASRLHITSDSSTSGYTGVTVDIPGIGTRRISVGPPDSAGTGFRSLRVAN